MSAPPPTPQSPDPLVQETRAFWRDLGRSMIGSSISTIDETAKQIIGVAGILVGFYFNAIAFGDLRGTIAGGWTLAIYLAPIVLLLISISVALLVFFPGRYRINFNSSEACRLLYERLVAAKQRSLSIASVFLVLGVLAVLVAMLVYLRGV